jgi:hypothetical protein
MDERFEKVKTLQNLLLSHATGSPADGADYFRLRRELLADPEIAPLLPRFVRTCRDLGQFWAYIKTKFGHYAERRQYLWDEFRPALEYLEGRGRSPADRDVSETLKEFNPDTVHALWTRALERRSSDPEGAITAARTLLESVCKHILDEDGVEYDDGADLPKLYRVTAEHLELAPSQREEPVFKQILGGCTAVVEGLGSLRNRLGDSHGKGKRPVRPAPRHAELAVNLAGTMATYLVSTWAWRRERGAG